MAAEQQLAVISARASIMSVSRKQRVGALKKEIRRVDAKYDALQKRRSSELLRIEKVASFYILILICYSCFLL